MKVEMYLCDTCGEMVDQDDIIHAHVPVWDSGKDNAEWYGDIAMMAKPIIKFEDLDLCHDCIKKLAVIEKTSIDTSTGYRFGACPEDAIYDGKQ